jgi:hypothetical protein
LLIDGWGTLPKLIENTKTERVATTIAIVFDACSLVAFLPRASNPLINMTTLPTRQGLIPLDDGVRIRFRGLEKEPGANGKRE